DRGIQQKLVDPRLVVARDFNRIESAERLAISFTLVEYRGPGKTRLGAFQDKELEQDPVVMLRDAPFLVVIVNVERVAARRPLAACLFVHCPLSENRFSW